MNSDDDYNDEDIDDESITSEDDIDGEDDNDNEQNGSTNGIEDTDGPTQSAHENEREKADALKQQIGLWDSFLELRIKLQKATIACNCLPSTSVAEDDELREAIDENATLFRKALALLLAIENRRSKKRTHHDTDADDDQIDEKTTDTTEVFKTLSKRFKHDKNAIDDELDKAYERFLPERDNVIQKWFERTRGFSKQNKNTVAEQSPLVQIKEIMSVPDRLIKRTQTSRIDYDLICPPSSPNTTESSTENAELFDDGDFYHQLLREFIERKTASITDPDQISKNWAQLRKLRSKLKKNVDTKASKDRKIRYNVHKKLVNYMAPIDRCSFTDEAKSDLFASLFGNTTSTIVNTEQTTPVNDIRII